MRFGGELDPRLEGLVDVVADQVALGIALDLLLVDLGFEVYADDLQLISASEVVDQYLRMAEVIVTGGLFDPPIVHGPGPPPDEGLPGGGCLQSRPTHQVLPDEIPDPLSTFGLVVASRWPSVALGPSNKIGRH